MKYIILLPVLALTGCGVFDREPDTFGDALIKHGAETRGLGLQWKKANENIEEGNELIEEGQDNLNKAKKLAEKGEDQIVKGRRMVKDATKQKQLIESAMIP